MKVLPNYRDCCCIHAYANLSLTIPCLLYTVLENRAFHRALIPLLEGSLPSTSGGNIAPSDDHHTSAHNHHHQSSGSTPTLQAYFLYLSEQALQLLASASRIRGGIYKDTDISVELGILR